MFQCKRRSIPSIQRSTGRGFDDQFRREEQVEANRSPALVEVPGLDTHGAGGSVF